LSLFIGSKEDDVVVVESSDADEAIESVSDVNKRDDDVSWAMRGFVTLIDM
jgi:hypothetical protein